MRIHRFFVNQHIPTQGRVKIEDDNTIHQWRNVLRFKIGQELVLFDPSGSEFHATIVSLGSKSDRGTDKIVEVEITASHPSNFHPRIPLFIYLSLPKRDAFEWIIEKGTELGVSGFVPVVSERSEKKEINTERTQKIATEASEQSGRSIRPIISEPIALADAIENLSGTTLVLDPRGEPFDINKISTKFGQVPDTSDFPDFLDIADNSDPAGNTDSAERINIFIGPEGGFSEKEIEILKTKGIRVVSLGSQVLRVETAVVAIVSRLLLFS